MKIIVFYVYNSALSVNEKNIATRANGVSVGQDYNETFVWMYQVQEDRWFGV